MRKVALIVEGPSDVDAGASLIAKSGKAFDMEFCVSEQPIKAGEVRKLRRAGELERYLELAASRKADSIIVLLDLDDLCAKSIAEEFGKRSAKISINHCVPIHFCFVVKEYECWFLASIQKIAAECEAYGIADDSPIKNPEKVRGAKQRLASLCSTRKYKESRDQNLFTKHIDIPLLSKQVRSFRKFAKALTGLNYSQLDAFVFDQNL